MLTDAVDLRQDVPPHEAMRPDDQRSEARADGAGLNATLFVRGVAYGARVGNISTSGAMIKVSARPLIDDHVVVAFEGCTPIHASVRWTRDGQIGLMFGPVLMLA